MKRTMTVLAAAVAAPSSTPTGRAARSRWEFYYSQRSCAAWIHRDSNGDRVSDGAMSESVDPGIDFAYTRIANNLNGRLAKATLICRNAHGSWALLSTDWY